MAQFQIAHPKENDTTPKHQITTQDIEFLTTLQYELNTQNNMGQADPKFWVIKGSKPVISEYNPYSDEEPDYYEVVDTEHYETIATDHKSMAEYINNNAPELKAEYDENSISINDPDNEYERLVYLDYYTEELLNIVSAYTYTEYEISCVTNEPYIYPNTLFLTHKACEEHLRKYSYNYSDDAHAYAMTADRSPEYEQLLKLIKTIDWNNLKTE